MTKYDYFKLAYRLGLTGNRAWIMRAYTQPIQNTNDKIGMFHYDDTHTPIVLLEDGTLDNITDADTQVPLYGVKEAVTLHKGDFILVDKTIETYYSNLLLNLLLIEYPFQGRIPYINKTFSPQLLDAIIVQGLKDKSISVPEYKEFSRALGLLSCLTTIAVPAATKRSVTPPKDIVAKRTAVLAKYKDQLDDPVIIAKIEKELVDYYKDYMEGDLAADYFLEEKNYTVALKRSEIMFGAEPQLDNTSKVNLSIPSLREGWDMDNLPDMVNSLRMGSYSRGKETALGGEAAKFSARVYQNTRMVETDCGSVVGVPFNISAYNKGSFIGRYRIVQGKPVEILPGDMDALQGKTVIIRSPQTCWTPNGNFCPICMGKSVSESGVGLGTMASEVGSVMLSISLSLFHGSVLSTKPYDYRESIT